MRGRQWLRECGGTRGVTVSGVVDPDPSALDSARRERLGAWDELGQALREARPRLAIVATPRQAHAASAIACLAAGCAVLVDKPLAGSLAEARRVVEAAGSSGRPALVGQNFRFRRLERTVSAALKEGRLGEPRAVTMVSARVTAPDDAHSALWEFCIHHLDLLRVRLSSPPESVEARVTRSGTTASYVVSLRFPGAVEALYRHDEGSPVFHWYEWLQGERAALAIELERVRLMSSRHRPRRVRLVRAPRPERVLLAHALAAADGGGAGGLSAEDNLATIATIEAVLASLRDGRETSPAELLAASEPASAAQPGGSRAERPGTLSGERAADVQ
jgi:predicted dehydrogenase